MAIALQKQKSRLPQIATIRKGSPKQKKQKKDGQDYEIMGKDLKYFRMDWMTDPFSQTARMAFESRYQPEPTNLNGYFMFNELDDHTWSAYYEGYRNGAMVIRAGNLPGEDPEIDYYLTAIDAQGNYLVKGGFDEDGNRKVYDPENLFITNRSGNLIKPKPIGRLYFVIPETITSNVIACVLLRTTSFNDVLNITNHLNFLFEMTGKLSAIPVQIIRRDEMVPVRKDDGQVIRTTKSLISIFANPIWARNFLQHKFADSSGMENPNLLPHISVLTGETAAQAVGSGEVDQVEGEIIYEDEPEENTNTRADDFDIEVANVAISPADARSMVINGQPAKEYQADDLRLFIENTKNLYINDEFENSEQEHTAIVRAAAAYMVLRDKNKN